MNRELVALAMVLSAVSLYFPTRSQPFTRVEVDGRAIRLQVTGTGEPTVVFENGHGAPLETWGKVQPAVSAFARTVAYDRKLDDGHAAAAELREALRRANVSPPFVLVGHSRGGLHARIFAGMYPGEVAGMVLVDPTHVEEARSAWPVLAAQAGASAVPAGIPVTLISAMGASDMPFMNAKVSAGAAARRAARLEDSIANHDWVRAIPGSRFVVTHRNGHNVPQEEPAVVIEAIRALLRPRPASP
jgi:pimeloyl-ACP methyl ester carboxylesterase